MKKLALVFSFLMVGAFSSFESSASLQQTTYPKPNYVRWSPYTKCCITYGQNLQIYVCGAKEYSCKMSEYLWYVFKDYYPPFSF